MVAHVGTSFSLLPGVRYLLIERPDVDPLGRRPLLALDDRAAPVEAEGVRDAVRVKAEEEHGVAFHRLHCNKKPTSFLSSEYVASVQFLKMHD
jgi:hypothetical protein